MKARRQQAIIGSLSVLLLAAIGFWIISNTEWATRQVFDPPKGEAADDPHFLLKRLVNGVGAHVETQQGLSKLPPEGATLLLEAEYWHFLPGNEGALRAWVERGGQLVIYKHVADDPLLADWTKVHFKSPPRPAPSKAAASAASGPASDEAAEDEDDGEDEDAARGGNSNRPATWSEQRESRRCPAVSEPVDSRGWYGEPRRYDVCQASGMFLAARATPIWSVEDGLGPQAMRVPVGKGTVTVSANWVAPRQSSLLEEDEAALFAALVQLHPGQIVWLVEEARLPGLPATVWQHAPMACVLAGLALVLILWRWSIRFAPLRAPTDLARRSIAEQVRGTAAFLLRHGPQALHRAQRRALEETAAGHVQGWQQFNAERRVATLAKLAQIPPELLARACDDTAVSPDMARVGQSLALMEAARRHITAAVPVTAGHASNPHSEPNHL